MIDLGRDRAELLAQIAAQAPAAQIVEDPGDPRLLAEDVRLLVSGHTRDEMFPLLEAVLSARFQATPREELLRDLLIPLRSALGNAWKHGNRCDAAKRIAVEALLRGGGTVISVADQGGGFDVALATRRLRERNRYFEHRGEGLRRLDRARSVVTWEDGGRTLVLCFRPSAPESRSGAAPAALDVDVPEGSLPPPFTRAHLASRPLAVADDGADGATTWRLLLRSDAEAHGPLDGRILTGRLHADAASAAAELDAATALRRAGDLGRVRIPAPVAPHAIDPRLVLFDFHPWMTLREYLDDRDDLSALERRAERIGRALAALHTGPVVFEGSERGADLPSEVEATLACARRHLVAQPGAADRLPRLHRLGTLAGALARRLSSAPAAPIHGRFGLDAVQHDVAGELYLDRFAGCRHGHPGFDLGAFAADLAAWAAGHGGAGVERAATGALLEGYRSRAALPLLDRELPGFAALALLERLRRLPHPIPARADAALAACEEAFERPAG
jgi:anti-sigma regulatory factor (Ser/Thr protein kinase)